MAILKRAFIYKSINKRSFHRGYFQSSIPRGVLDGGSSNAPALLSLPDIPKFKEWAERRLIIGTELNLCMNARGKFNCINAINSASSDKLRVFTRTHTHSSENTFQTPFIYLGIHLRQDILFLSSSLSLSLTHAHNLSLSLSLHCTSQALRIGFFTGLDNNSFFHSPNPPRNPKERKTTCGGSKIQ